MISKQRIQETSNNLRTQIVKACHSRLKQAKKDIAALRGNPKGYLKTFVRNNKANLIFVGVILVILSSLGVNVWLKSRSASDIIYDKNLPAQTAMESHMLFAGDIYWGRRMNDWSQTSKLKEAYPFHKLDTLQPEIYDAWVGNLECPAVPGVKQPVGFVPQLWEFNCDTDYLPHAAKWFEVFSLANNHTQNQKREAGLEATRKSLDDHGIQHFGHFNAHVKKDVCEVISMPARARLDGKQQEVRMPVALCGFDGVYYTLTDQSIGVMQKFAKSMPVIAMPHMGQEYQAIADKHRRGLYQKMIDNGADVVIGNHPHWVQPTEVYKGKLITYSLGNFIFDQDFSQEVMRSAAIDVTMTLKSGAASEEQLKGWVALGADCLTFHDECLAQAQARGLTRLPVSFTFDIVGIDTSNKVTKRANLRGTNSILERLNWADTQQKLQAASK